MKHIYNDGGRSEAGFKGNAGDCVTRAICIATNQPYLEVYNALRELNKEFMSKRSARAKRVKRKGPTARNGVFREVYQKYLESIGWTWTPTMLIGSGCKVHLHKDEVPSGRIIVRLSKHLAAVVNKELHDTYDCTREGTRCVYGYFKEAA